MVLRVVKVATQVGQEEELTTVARVAVRVELEEVLTMVVRVAAQVGQEEKLTSVVRAAAQVELKEVLTMVVGQEE